MREFISCSLTSPLNILQIGDDSSTINLWEINVSVDLMNAYKNESNLPFAKDEVHGHVCACPNVDSSFFVCHTSGKVLHVSITFLKR